MSKLREKKINLIRTYIDPTKDNVPIPSLDYDIVYPNTVYEAIHKTMEDDSTTLDQELNSIYRMISEKQNTIEGKTPGALMTWSNIKGEIGSTEMVRNIGEDQSRRSHSKVPTEKAVGQALDLKTNAVDFNRHNSDNERHILESEREKWNEMTPLSVFNDHKNNTDSHITAAERIAWNAKANQELVNSHISNSNNPHNVTAHQVGTYSREEVDKMFESIRESFFNYRNINYDERTDIAKLEEYKSSNWNPNFILAYADTLPTVTDQSLTYFALKPVTDYATNESQECIIYIKKPGLVWKEVGIQKMTPGDMVIRYPDTTMCVWVQGRFISIFTGSSSSDGSSSGNSTGGWIWRPIVTENGVLSWTKSSESAPPSPVTIKGEPGHTPVKGVDYFDGAPGIGLPSSGSKGDIVVKATNEDYDTEWKSVNKVLEDYFNSGGKFPEGASDWESIKGRPRIYQETGTDENGLMSQKIISEKFSVVEGNVTRILNDIGNTSGIVGMSETLSRHINNFSNPHRITPELIGAVSANSFSTHTQSFENPHNVTAAQVGLGNVNNTADVDKPVSLPTQRALDAINEKIGEINNSLNGGKLVTNVAWDNARCKLTFTFKDSSELEVIVPLIDIFKTISYDNDRNELVIQLPDGSEHRVSVLSLITAYVGENGKHINVSVREGKISASLVTGSITGDELIESIHLRNSPTTTTQLPDDDSHKIATTKFVRSTVIDNLVSHDAYRPLSANMGRILNQNKVDVQTVLELIAETPVNVVDSLSSTDTTAALSANMGHELFITKAPTIHTSTTGSTYGRATADLFGHARAGNSNPLMDGIVSIGTDNGYYARADHRHPTDISRAPINFPDGEITKLTGAPKAENPPDDSNDERIATTSWVKKNFGSKGGYIVITPDEIRSSVQRGFAAITQI